MTTPNAYCTLAEFKQYITHASADLQPSASDDKLIERLVVRASRRIDDLMARRFYPRVETRSYDVPSGRDLWLYDDLLEVTTLTNGDDNTIASTEYTLHPANEYPKYKLVLTEATTYLWEEDSSSNSEQVIDVLGYWGYHDRYATDAWTSVGTLGAAWNSTTTLTATMTAGHTLAVGGGQVVKIDNELFNSSSAGDTSLVVAKRGDNGSTAGTHASGATVYVWNYLEDINELALEMTNMMYRSRSGMDVEAVSTITAAGVVITPRSLPIWARELIAKYQRRVY